MSMSGEEFAERALQCTGEILCVGLIVGIILLLGVAHDRLFGSERPAAQVTHNPEK